MNKNAESLIMFLGFFVLLFFVLEKFACYKLLGLVQEIQFLLFIILLLLLLFRLLIILKSIVKKYRFMSL